MTNDTSYREKGRAVFLAAIMVLSMVAGAAVLTGSAAASHDPGERTEDWNDFGNAHAGQTINISVGSVTGVEYVEFTEDDGSGFDVDNATDGYATFTVPEGASGDWTFTAYDDTGSPTGTPSNFTINVRQNSIDTFAFADSVQQDGQTAAVIETNRLDWNATIESDELSNDELMDIFGSNGNVDLHDGEAVYVEASNADISLSASPSTDIETGTYNITLDVVDTSASADAQLEVTGAVEGAADITPGSVSQEVGDVATFNIETSGNYAGDTIYVQAVDEHGVLNYTFSTTVEDSAAFTMNSYTAVHDNGLAFNSPTDDVSVTEVDNSSQSIGEARLQPSRVNLRTYAEDPVTNANPQQLDRGFIRLQERSLDSGTTYTAPGSTNLDNLNNSQLIGASTERSDVANGDHLIAQFQGSGLYGYMMDGDTFDPQSEDLNISIQSTADPAYQDPPGITIGDGADLTTYDGVSVREDPENNQFYVVVDPANLDGNTGIASDDLQAGDTWEVAFTIGEDNPYVTADESVNTTFDLTERDVSFDEQTNDDDVLQIPNGANQSVSGTSTIAPGAEVSVSAFFDTEILDGSAEIQEDGTWSATLGDLSGYEGGTQFTVQAQESGNLQTGGSAADTGEMDAVVGGDAAAASFSASGDAPGSVEVDGDATLEWTVTNDGDASDTVDYTVTVGGEEVDSGSEELAPGNSTSGTYDIDTSSAGDVSWTVETQHASDEGTVTVEDDSGTEGETETGGETETEGETEDDDGDDGDGGGGQPGFGLVVALFALIGAALLALRRQN